LGALVGVSGGGVVEAVGVVGSPLTVSGLALKVIPAINVMKAQLVGMTNGLPVMEASKAELKAGQLDSSRKLAELSRKVTEMCASVKYLNDWTIAAEFAQLPKGAVGSSGQVFSLSTAPPQGVGIVMMSAAVPKVLASTLVNPSLPELLASDIDSLFE